MSTSNPAVNVSLDKARETRKQCKNGAMSIEYFIIAKCHVVILVNKQRKGINEVGRVTHEVGEMCVPTNIYCSTPMLKMAE